MPNCDFKYGLLQSRTKTRQIPYLDPPQHRPFVSFTEFQADPDHASFLPKRERAIRHVPNVIEIFGNQNLILESRRIKNETFSALVGSRSPWRWLLAQSGESPRQFQFAGDRAIPIAIV